MNSKSKHLRAKDMRQAGTLRLKRNIDALGLRIQRHMQYVEKREEFQTAFVEAHPCEVWDKDGNFHSRYASMVCAARTVLQLGGGSVVDASPGNLEGTWDLGDCKKNVAASTWVFGSRKYEPRYAN